MHSITIKTDWHIRYVGEEHYVASYRNHENYHGTSSYSQTGMFDIVMHREEWSMRIAVEQIVCATEVTPHIKLI